jgi:hypothetical protein
MAEKKATKPPKAPKAPGKYDTFTDEKGELRVCGKRGNTYAIPGGDKDIEALEKNGKL